MDHRTACSPLSPPVEVCGPSGNRGAFAKGSARCIRVLRVRAFWAIRAATGTCWQSELLTLWGSLCAMVYARGLLRMLSSLYGVTTAHLPGQKPGRTCTALRGWKLPASVVLAQAGTHAPIHPWPGVAFLGVRGIPLVATRYMRAVTEAR